MTARKYAYLMVEIIGISQNLEFSSSKAYFLPKLKNITNLCDGIIMLSVKNGFNSFHELLKVDSYL